MTQTDLKTPHHQFSLLAPAQAMKHIIINEALTQIDTHLNVHIRSKSRLSPPSEAAIEDRFICPPLATGPWSAFNVGSLLYLGSDHNWKSATPEIGLTAWVEDEDHYIVWAGAEWVRIGADVERTESLGVGTDADEINRLSVRSDSVLFSHSHDGADIRCTLNRATQTDTASVIYQTDFSGRVEAGLMEDNQFRIKVSSDGQNWVTALRVDPVTAQVSLPRTSPDLPLMSLLGDGGRFAGSPEPAGITVGAFQAPSYFESYNGSQFSAGPTYTYDSSTYGGVAAPLAPEVDELLTQIYGGANSPHQRYGKEFNIMEVTAGSGTTFAETVNGVDHHLILANDLATVPQRFSWTVWIKLLSGSLVVAPGDNCLSAVNGNALDVPIPVQMSDGWVNARFLYDIPQHLRLGYVFGCLRLFATSGTRILMAMPSLIAGTISLNDPAPFRTGTLDGWA